MYIKAGDMVAVIAGKEVGKQGKVLRIVLEKQRVTIEKINMMKKHMRPSQENQQGGIVEREGTVHLSNVMLICNKCDKGVRIGNKVLDDGTKVRICRSCGEQI